MPPPSARMAAELRRSHQQVNEVVLLPVNGPPIDLTAAVSAGMISSEVSISIKADVRRSLSMTVVDATSRLIPRQFGAALAAPSRVRVAMGVRYGDNTTEVLPVGTFGLARPETNDGGANMTVSVDGYDRSRRIRRNRWTHPVHYPQGINYGNVIRDIIANRLTGQVRASDFHFTDTTRRLPSPGLMLGLDTDNDPWRDAISLAEDIGRRLYVAPSDAFILEEVPELAAAPIVATYGPGEADFHLLSVSRVIDDEPGYNGVIGKAVGPHLFAPLRSEAWDTDPQSPTYFLGPWGRVPRFWTSPLVSTQAQLDAAVRTLLRTVIGGTERVSFSALPNPALDVGDVITVRRDRAGVAGQFEVEEIRLPQGGAAMSVTCVERRLTA